MKKFLHYLPGAFVFALIVGFFETFTKPSGLGSILILLLALVIGNFVNEKVAARNAE
jgi:hypothetical protein